MALKFVTSLHTGALAPLNEEAWSTAMTDAYDLRKKLRSEGRMAEADELLDYCYPPKLHGGYDLSGMVVEPLNENTSPFFIVGRQVNEGLLGLSPIYLLSLCLEGQGAMNALCEALPFRSQAHGRSFFEACLEQQPIGEMVSVLGESPEVRAFALCMLPESTKHVLSQPSPARADVEQVASELGTAIATLVHVVERWQREDAFRYLVEWPGGGRGMRHQLFHPTIFKSLKELPDHFNRTVKGLGEAPKISGRRAQGGKQHMVALLIRAMWLRCGVAGKVSSSASSRFMKACNLILPMYGIRKADYSQFMRSELAKRRVKGVVIGK